MFGLEKKVTLLSKIKYLYRKQEFNPDLIGIFTNPFYFSRKNIRRALKQVSPDIRGAILDVGCGSKPYQRLFNVDRYTGLDLDSSGARSSGIADRLYDGEVFPFEDEEFDGLICTQVLEHVANPDFFLDECCRVLKPGAIAIFTVPFIWSEHEKPSDFSRYTSFGIISIVDRHGFRFKYFEKLNNDFSLYMQLINNDIWAWRENNSLWCARSLAFIPIAILNIVGLFGNLLFHSFENTYLDNFLVVFKND